MNPQEINIAIAEACGWKRGIWKGDCCQGKGWLEPGKAPKDALEHNGSIAWHANELPNCYSDLNACAEMEATLTPQECYLFNEFIARSLDYWNPKKGAANWPFHATAPQRCEAFLRVKGLWKGGE